MTVHLFPSSDFARFWGEGFSSSQQSQFHPLQGSLGGPPSLQEEAFWEACVQTLPTPIRTSKWLGSRIQQLFQTAAKGRVEVREWRMLASHPELPAQTKNIFQSLLPCYQQWLDQNPFLLLPTPSSGQTYVAHGWNAWSPQASWTPYGYLRDLQDMAISLQEVVYLPIVEAKFLSASEMWVQPWLPLLHHFSGGALEELRLVWDQPPPMYYTPLVTNHQECQLLSIRIQQALARGAQRVVLIAQTSQRRQRLVQTLSALGIATVSSSSSFPEVVDSLAIHPELRFVLETYRAERPLAHLAAHFEELPEIALLRSNLQEVASAAAHASAIGALARWIQQRYGAPSSIPFSVPIATWLNTSMAQENCHAWEQWDSLLHEGAALPSSPLSRETFVALLSQNLSRRCKFPRIDSKTPSVMVTGLDDHCSRGTSCDVLFFTGFCDAEYPLPYPSDSLGITAEVGTLHRILGRPVWPLSISPSVQASWLLQAIYHAQEVHWIRTSCDSRGRNSLPSRYESWVLPLGESMDWKPNPMDVFVTPEISEIIDIEQNRQKIMPRSYTDLPAWLKPLSLSEKQGTHVGVLQEKTEGIETLGSIHQALSASALENYAQCPFRFFAHTLLKSNPPSLFAEEATTAQYGTLAHQTLRMFFQKLLATHQLPLQGTAEEQRLLEQAFQQALAELRVEWSEEQWVVIESKLPGLRKDLWLLIQKEASSPTFPLTEPRWFEYSFCLPLGSKEQPIYMKGLIDRIDTSPEQALILDYKLGNLAFHEERLRNQLNVTSFQLPLYAFALRQDPTFAPLRSIQARYYSIRQQKISNQAVSDTDLDLSAIEAITKRIRMGRFEVQPTTCNFCDLRALCRINNP